MKYNQTEYNQWKFLNTSILGNYTKMAIQGAVIGIEIKWNCNLDYDFMTYCLPKYSFHILDANGWNFPYAVYHEENRRTLVKGSE